jgi:hypothetical protein
MKFKITIEEEAPEGYKQYSVEFVDFEDSFIEETGATITAREWAEDYAYNKADKAQFKVEEI